MKEHCKGRDFQQKCILFRLGVIDHNIKNCGEIPSTEIVIKSDDLNHPTVWKGGSCSFKTEKKNCVVSHNMQEV